MLTVFHGSSGDATQTAQRLQGHSQCVPKKVGSRGRQMPLAGKVDRSVKFCQAQGVGWRGHLRQKKQLHKDLSGRSSGCLWQHAWLSVHGLCAEGGKAGGCGGCKGGLQTDGQGAGLTGKGYGPRSVRRRSGAWGSGPCPLWGRAQVQGALGPVCTSQ